MNQSFSQTQTGLAYLWTKILTTPFWAIYNLLPIILYKDLHLSAFQVTTLIALKPMTSLLSMYWSSWINKRPDRLVGNVAWGNFWAHVPFFLFPWMQNPWFFILSYGISMLFSRGTVPAWMEILRLNLPEIPRQKVFGYAQALGFVGGGLLPLTFGWILDDYEGSWRWILFGTAALSLGATYFQFKIPIHSLTSAQDSPTPISLTKPWKDAWKLLKDRPDFLFFQVGFMLGGGGLILSQPALPSFFWDVLHLTYVDLTIAISLCKAIGYAVTTPIWTRFMHRIDIYRFTALVSLLAFIFPLTLIAANWSLAWLYTAYFIYGMMQAGSELSWNLSGPIFAKNEDSSLFSSINILMVGLRGCAAPYCGGLICGCFSSTTALIVGGLLSLLSTIWMIYNPYTAVKEKPEVLLS